MAPLVETTGTGELVPKGPEGGSTAEVKDINGDPAAEAVFLQWEAWTQKDKPSYIIAVLVRSKTWNRPITEATDSPFVGTLLLGPSHLVPGNE